MRQLVEALSPEVLKCISERHSAPYLSGAQLLVLHYQVLGIQYALNCLQAIVHIYIYIYIYV